MGKSFSQYFLHQTGSLREREYTLGTVFQVVKDWMQVISCLYTHWKTWVEKVKEALRKYSASELFLKIAAAWKVEMGVFLWRQKGTFGEASNWLLTISVSLFTASTGE